jgi:hypothetical protein
VSSKHFLEEIMKVLVTACCFIVAGLVFADADDRPTAECLKFVMGQGISLSMSSSICKGGVDTECLAFVQANRSSSSVSRAASFCKGGVKRDCLEYAMNSSERDRSVTSVAKFCTGWVSTDCLRFMAEEYGKDVSSASNFCRNGVEVACLRYVLSLGKSISVAHGMCTP